MSESGSSGSMDLGTGAAGWPQDSHHHHLGWRGGPAVSVVINWIPSRAVKGVRVPDIKLALANIQTLGSFSGRLPPNYSCRRLQRGL